MVPLIALVLTLLAAVVGAVLLEPQLAMAGVPEVVRTFTPFLLLPLLLSPAFVLSGDWLWVNNKRRQGPQRGAMMARLAVFTSLVALVVPLVLTERALEEVARESVKRAARWMPEAQAAPTAALPVPPAPTGLAVAEPVQPVRRWGPTQPALPPSPPAEPTPPAPVLPVEGAVLLVPPAPPPDGTFFVYEWVDRAGEAHYSDDFEGIPNDGKVLRAIAMKPTPAGLAPAPLQPKLPAPAARRDDPFATGLMPSMAEQYWRSRFQPMHRRIKDQEKRITAKQEEINAMSAAVNREFAFAQLRKLKDDLKELEQDLQDLERDASHRAVPREWRE